MRFDEILLNNQLLINIYGDDPTLDDLYDSEAYQIIEEITFNDIIEIIRTVTINDIKEYNST